MINSVQNSLDCVVLFEFWFPSYVITQVMSILLNQTLIYITKIMG